MKQESRILHIFDDEIICRATIDLYKKLTQFDQNYLVISYTPEKWADFYPNDDTVVSIPVSDNSHKVLGEKIKDYDIIILQAFSVGKAKAIIEQKFSDKVFIWALWGYGLYNIVNYFTSSENNLTTTIAKKSIKQRIQDYYNYRVVYRKALRKINLCVFLLEHDFELLGKAMDHNASWMTACYQTEENLFGEMGTFTVDGNDILIGNSSTPSNRHQLVFDELKACDLGSIKVDYSTGVWRREL